MLACVRARARDDSETAGGLVEAVDREPSKDGYIAQATGCEFKRRA
jgi:hypothetical protein